ncbi:MAG: YlxR family protein, partial [Proteobacteria bacterium]|nr:YlxR family protein [Pseudomonadota bacterium]
MCRRSDPKNELLRFVASVQGITWDSAHRLPGRGAYIHRSVSCWVKAGERTRWEHAFRGATGITQEG